MGNYDPAAAASNWSSRLAQSGPKITAGVNGVTTAPGQAAAKAAGLWAQNVAAAQAKFQRNVAAVSLESWRQATIEKGIPRISQGAQQAQSKVQDFQTQFLPVVQRTVEALPARGTFEQNAQRAMQVMSELHKFSYKRTS